MSCARAEDAMAWTSKVSRNPLAQDVKGDRRIFHRRIRDQTGGGLARGSPLSFGLDPVHKRLLSATRGRPLGLPGAGAARRYRSSSDSRTSNSRLVSCQCISYGCCPFALSAVGCYRAPDDRDARRPVISRPSRNFETDTIRDGIIIKGSSGQVSAPQGFYTPIGTPGYTVLALPAGVKGQRAYVTDAISCLFLGAVTGGGSTFCPVVFNGSKWVGG